MQVMGLRNVILGAILLCGLAVYGQSEQDILFKVEDIEVPVSEFEYIYEKNNRDGADYTEFSLREYLDLYAKFKLKVKKARDLQLDTISALNAELAGYRTQLAKSYLNDREVTDRLTKEAYDRMQTDVRIAHILFRVPRNAPSSVEDAVLNQARHAYERIEGGAGFADIALEVSNDKATRDNGGDMGFLTAMLPSGFYEMESTMYDLEVGEVSEPVRTTIGYHILKVLEKRPARGKVEIAHILARVNDNPPNEASAMSKINGIHKRLLEGASFEEIAKDNSDDSRTAVRGGYIGKIGINSYDPVFEQAAFSLENPGDISEPIRSKVGWHIIKLIQKVPMGSYNDEKRKLEAAMAGDERMEIARVEMLKRIKEESGFAVDTVLLKVYTSELGEEFQSFKWNKPDMPEQQLITFKDGSVKTTDEFSEYLLANARIRMRAQGNETAEATALSMFEDFADDACISYEEKHLTEKYPEFSALMREYEEGILLFEVTKMMVWDKASTDTAGLKAFHEKNEGEYMWPERARVITYTVDTQDEKVSMKAYKRASELSTEDWAAEVEKDDAKAGYEEKKMLKAAVEERGWKWEEGYVTPLMTDPNFGASFSIITELLSPEPKKLSEARGYVIADYQDYLEKEWVRSLTEEYEVLVNEELLESLIRKQ